MTDEVASRSSISIPAFCRVPAGATGDGVRTLAVRVESALDSSESKTRHSPTSARSLLVTSIDVATPVIACQMATVLAGSGRQTCLVEASPPDGPNDAFVSQAAGMQGLFDWLAHGGKAPFELLETEVPSLKLVPRGLNDRVSEQMLRADMVRRFNAEVSRECNRIVWAGPPLAMAAGLAVAGAVDGIVLVVSPGRVTRSAAQRARESIAAVRGRLLGTVLADL